jgi:hypothetical protein
MPAIMRPTDPQTAAELVRSRHGARISSPQPPPTDLEQIEAHFGSRPRSSSAADREWSVSFVMPMRSVVSIRWPVLPRPHGDCGGPQRRAVDLFAPACPPDRATHRPLNAPTHRRRQLGLASMPDTPSGEGVENVAVASTTSDVDGSSNFTSWCRPSAQHAGHRTHTTG